jgi:hypothetical protein
MWRPRWELEIPTHLLHSCAWDPQPRGTILIATRSPVCLCSASSTVPLAPLHQRPEVHQMGLSSTVDAGSEHARLPGCRLVAADDAWDLFASQCPHAAGHRLHRHGRDGAQHFAAANCSCWRHACAADVMTNEQ